MYECMFTLKYILIYIYILIYFHHIYLDHSVFVLINVYCPFASMHDEDRFAFKMKFKSMLTRCICALQAKGRRVVG